MEKTAMGNAGVEAGATALDSLLDRVYREAGYDFRGYKHGTVTRRLERRLGTVGARNYPEYLRFLESHPGEYRKLAEYLTIKVSGFFRNPYTFNRVAGLVFPELISYKRARGERSLRFWSAACARGEEPYSLAIMLADFLGERCKDFDISIYATDVSLEALREVEAGVYSLKDIEGVPGALRESYFAPCEGGYEVRDDIRRMVSFSPFDLTLIRQQPLLNLDCIFCCNVLIYFQRHLQERVLGMLYDSLATPGYLVLGEVETVPDNLRDRLECLDGRVKIYKKANEG